MRRGLLAFAAMALTGKTARAAEEVDLLLVLAVDVSGSVSEERFRLQRKGYADAFRDPRLQAAIRSGPLGAIVVAMFQ